ncbi:DUF4865 family protein [Bradyrhizobium icense]|uniref:DUF4865 family protein n=1 Tax=Bradyrhizobium icense TaxID=1274631 RepID=A0A1B1UBL3_9BRAD|nr:DUF4865 family protein [Bradyrhizobium icense]ANW00168.1 hypothetical protein LMTR13_08240 [Bradyrhizobium icense]
MLVKHYLHRLPADYEMQRITSRARQRGAIWNDVPHLAFKAFMIQRQGQSGSVRNAYSSLYLWRRVDGLTDFILGDRFQNVITTFGRPEIDTWLPFYVRRGLSHHAKFATIEVSDVSLSTRLADLRQIEHERSHTTMMDDNLVISLAALDISRWRLARFSIFERLESLNEKQQLFSIAYFAAPELEALRTII